MDNHIGAAVHVQDDSEVFSGLCRWVTLAMILTTGFAWLVAFRLFDPMAEVLGYGFFAVWGGALIVGTVGALFLRRRIWGFENGTAFFFLVVYSLMTGLVLSITMMPYPQATVAQVYLPPVGMFALISVYAQFTGQGSISGLGLLGLAVALALKLYLGTSWAAFALGVLAVLVFLVLTAWNIDKVREVAAKGEERKAALTGALAIFIGLMVCLMFWVFLFSPSGRHRK